MKISGRLFITILLLAAFFKATDSYSKQEKEDQDIIEKVDILLDYDFIESMEMIDNYDILLATVPVETEEYRSKDNEDN